MSDHEPSFAPQGIPLPALVVELRCRREAVSRLQGGASYFHEDLGIFRKLAEEQGFLLRDAPDFLSTPPDDEGNEHQVWFQPEARAVLKATWPDFFGLLVIHRTNEEPKASPIDYLERWALHNELFGDEVVFLGALSSDSGLRLLIRQPAIAGSPATEEEIRRFFTSSGWRALMVDGNTAYFDAERRVVISDTHRGNLVKMDDGLLAPIDLRVQAVSGALLGIVHGLASSNPE